MSRASWTCVKVVLKIALVNPQNRYDHPVGALSFDGFFFQLPEELEYTNLNAIVMCFHNDFGRCNLRVHFFEEIPNLKLLDITFSIFSDDTILILSKLPLLKAISLNDCEISAGQLSNLLEGCAALEEIRLYFSTFEATSIKIPPMLKSFEIESNYGRIEQIDASDCIQLEYLQV
jgi:hypothetical protein